MTQAPRRRSRCLEGVILYSLFVQGTRKEDHRVGALGYLLPVLPVGTLLTRQLIQRRKVLPKV